MIEYPPELRYSHNHVWVDIEDEDKHLARIGITDYLREELPEILSLDLPMEDAQVEMDDECIMLHLAGEEDDEFWQVRAPLGGHVAEINREVQSNPDLLHIAPYKHWIMRLEYDDPSELELLMDADKYVVFLERM